MEKAGLTAGYFIFLFLLFLSNDVPEAALSWCHGLHIDCESKTREILVSGIKEVIPHPRGEGRETTQSVSRGKGTNWVFLVLAESNPLEKRNI